MVDVVPRIETAAASGARIRARVELLRVPQWTKNAFVLAPLFFARRLDDPAAIERVVPAVVAFCAASSLVYVVNDWSDRHEDARHPSKRHRPLAAGVLGGVDAALQAVVLAAVVVAACATLRTAPAVVLPIAAYLVLNAAYSLRLRSVSLVDVAVIAAGFVLRVLAGAGAVGVPPSSWIVLCTGLLALLLGLGKRRGDLAVETPASRASLDGYDLPFVDLALGVVSASVITFYALFTVSDYSLGRFGSEHLYLTTFPVALAVLRYLQVLVRGGFAGSPTDIVLHDRPLQALTVVWLALFAVLGDVLGGAG